MNMGILGKALKAENSSADQLPGVLYEKHAPALLSLCMRYCANIQDAEDVLHEGFIKIIKSLHTFKDKGNGSFEGWMRRIMVNTALNHIRDHARERKFLDIDPIAEKLDLENEQEEDHFGEIAGRIKPEIVMEMICQLPAGYRAVFNMYVFESFSHREIAQALNCSENTSKSQLSKARAMLRKRLNQHLEMKMETNEKV